MNVTQKKRKLYAILTRCKQTAVAFSGGCDSSFLLAAAINVLGKNHVLAVTAVSETYTPSELALCRLIARSLGAKHRIIHTKELADKNFSSNPLDRCFYCKDELFSKLHRIAKKNNLVIIDGSTASDMSDYRPGKRAAHKWMVQHPLQEAGFTKEDIRSLSKDFRLPTWNLPPGACLASRIPYGEEITTDKLRKIHRAERYLKNMGFALTRVRLYNNEIARIEVDVKKLKIIFKGEIKNKIIHYFKQIGFTHITVDLQGYRTGSMNPD
ncbi:MAG: ATP-dependent sacrificial sulfur transferase LarE [bacterium]